MSRVIPTFTVLEEVNPAGFHILQFTDGEFEGIKFHYSEVAVEEEDDSAKLHFEYTVTDGAISEAQKSDFEQTLGDILLHMLEEQIAEQKVVYAGGTDDKSST